MTFLKKSAKNKKDLSSLMKEEKMPKKKTISVAKADAIVKDLKERLGDQLKDLACADTIIKEEVLAKHFNIVETDFDEIECSGMEDGFSV